MIDQVSVDYAPARALRPGEIEMEKIKEQQRGSYDGLSNRDTDIATLSADLLRIIVNANLGIPGKPGGEVARQIVREVRALYDEVDKPTPTPKRRQQAQTAITVDQDRGAYDDGIDPADILDEFEEGEIG